MSTTAQAALAVALLLTACHRAELPPPHDATRPAAQRGSIDFAPLFRGNTRSRSVYTHALRPGTMDRVLLAPSVVFESSRSSLAEPPTTGPTLGTSAAPVLTDALGERISFDMSAHLLSVLDQRHSTLVVPAITRTWCGADPACASASWVERTLLLVESGRLGDHAPTAALAVRVLGLAPVVTPVTIASVGAGDGLAFTVSPRSRPDERTRCTGVELGVMSLAFQAEIVSLPGGELIARIDEERAFSAPGADAFRAADVELSVPAPDYATDALGRRYVSSWHASSTVCDHVAEEYERLVTGLGTGLVTSGEIDAIIYDALRPLFGGTP